MACRQANVKRTDLVSLRFILDSLCLFIILLFIYSFTYFAGRGVASLGLFFFVFLCPTEILIQ